MPSHPLTNFGKQKCYQNEPKFNGVYSRNNLPKIKNGEYPINLDEHESVGTHWIAFHVNNNNATCFERFGVEHIPKEIKRFRKKNRRQKYYNKCLEDTSIRFDNGRILLYWIY